MMFKTLLRLDQKHERAIPDFEKHDIKYPESLVRYFLKKYTKPGDKVFDPFAGLGTTLVVAEEMNRIPYGIEKDRKRYDWVTRQLQNKDNFILGDALNMTEYDFPKFDFSMTSPPYMPKHHKWNPLYAGDTKYAGYDNYLKALGKIYRDLAKFMKKGAYVVVQVDNLRGKVYTPLAWDIGRVIGDSLKFEGEIILENMAKNSQDLDHTYCLVYKK